MLNVGVDRKHREGPIEKSVGAGRRGRIALQPYALGAFGKGRISTF